MRGNARGVWGMRGPDCQLSPAQRQLPNSICQFYKYLSKLLNVFVKITKCICQDNKMYLSKSLNCGRGKAGGGFEACMRERSRPRLAIESRPVSRPGSSLPTVTDITGCYSRRRSIFLLTLPVSVKLLRMGNPKSDSPTHF